MNWRLIAIIAVVASPFLLAGVILLVNIGLSIRRSRSQFKQRQRELTQRIHNGARRTAGDILREKAGTR